MEHGLCTLQEDGLVDNVVFDLIEDSIAEGVEHGLRTFPDDWLVDNVVFDLIEDSIAVGVELRHNQLYSGPVVPGQKGKF